MFTRCLQNSNFAKRQKIRRTKLLLRGARLCLKIGKHFNARRERERNFFRHNRLSHFILPTTFAYSTIANIRTINNARWTYVCVYVYSFADSLERYLNANDETRETPFHRKMNGVSERGRRRKSASFEPRTHLHSRRNCVRPRKRASRAAIYI